MFKDSNNFNRSDGNDELDGIWKEILYFLVYLSSKIVSISGIRFYTVDRKFVEVI